MKPFSIANIEIPKESVYYRVTVHGNPIAKARARVGKFGAYTPKKTVEWEDKLRSHFLELTKGFVLTEPVGIKVSFFCETRGPKDWDNMIKCVKDASNGVIWVDDDQCQEGPIRKDYDKNNPRVEIVFYATTSSFGKGPPQPRKKPKKRPRKSVKKGFPIEDLL